MIDTPMEIEHGNKRSCGTTVNAGDSSLVIAKHHKCKLRRVGPAKATDATLSASPIRGRRFNTQDYPPRPNPQKRGYQE